VAGFDACIDLTRDRIPEGVDARDAVQWIREAVEAMPGAAWISVMDCGMAPSHLPWIRVFSVAGGLQMPTAKLEALTAEIEATVWRALRAAA